jgi:hypothetical protein
MDCASEDGLHSAHKETWRGRPERLQTTLIVTVTVTSPYTHEGKVRRGEWAARVVK